MSSRKPQGKSGYLPTDYAEARKQPSAQDFTGGTAADLAIPSLPPGGREERNAAAVRYLRRRNAADLLDILGLVEAVEPPAKLTGPLSVPCPTCGVDISVRCKASGGGAYQRGHLARRLRADELREAAA